MSAIVWPLYPNSRAYGSKDSYPAFLMSTPNLHRIFGQKSLNSQNAGDSTRNTTGQLENENDEKYKRANTSLVFRSQQLKIEVALSRKEIDKLRAENERLRSKVRVLECGVDNEKIDMLVAERLQRRLGQLQHVSTRTVDFLRQSMGDFENIMNSLFSDDMESEEPEGIIEKYSRTRRPVSMTAAKRPSLSKVKESPLRVSRVEPDTNENQMTNTDVDSRLCKQDASTINVSRGRRSNLHQIPYDMPNEFQDDVAPTLKTPPKRSQPIRVAPKSVEVPNKNLATPVVAFKRPVTTRTDTPVTAFGDTDTVRRKRAAAAKIQSMAEPSLTMKMRKPGKYDIPSPYISQGC